MLGQIITKKGYETIFLFFFHCCFMWCNVCMRCECGCVGGRIVRSLRFREVRERKLGKKGGGDVANRRKIVLTI